MSINMEAIRTLSSLMQQVFDGECDVIDIEITPESREIEHDTARHIVIDHLCIRYRNHIREEDGGHRYHQTPFGVADLEPNWSNVILYPNPPHVKSCPDSVTWEYVVNTKPIGCVPEFRCKKCGWELYQEKEDVDGVRRRKNVFVHVPPRPTRIK